MQHPSFVVINQLAKNMPKDALPTPRMVTVTATLIILELTKAVFASLYPDLIPGEQTEALLALVVDWGPTMIELIILWFVGRGAPADPRISDNEKAEKVEAESK